MNQLTFRTILGGPNSPDAYEAELKKVKSAVRDVEFQFDLDLALTIGSDMVDVTYPTGLNAPRISLPKRTVTGTIFINEADTKTASDHARFFREVLYAALTDIFDRLDKKAPDFDKDAELAKIDFLKE